MPSELFDLTPHLNRWLPWREVKECFWPGVGKRSNAINPALASIRNTAGIYCIAWEPIGEMPAPDEINVQYIGQTKNFKNRIAQFATSAGLRWDDRYSGHSAAWRWPQGKETKMKIAFFPLQGPHTDHMQTGHLFWYEALAIESFYLKHSSTLPPLNISKNPVALTLE